MNNECEYYRTVSYINGRVGYIKNIYIMAILAETFFIYSRFS